MICVELTSRLKKIFEYYLKSRIEERERLTRCIFSNGLNNHKICCFSQFTQCKWCLDFIMNRKIRKEMGNNCVNEKEREKKRKKKRKFSFLRVLFSFDFKIIRHLSIDSNISILLRLLSKAVFMPISHLFSVCVFLRETSETIFTARKKTLLIYIHYSNRCYFCWLTITNNRRT